MEVGRRWCIFGGDGSELGEAEPSSRMDGEVFEIRQKRAPVFQFCGLT
jgi:hypothetical protein